MTNEQLRSLVLECLKKEPPFDPSRAPLQLSTIFDGLADIVKRQGLRDPSGFNLWLGHDRAELHPSLRISVADIVWDLIVEGILRPGSGTNPSDLLFPLIHLTSYGKQVIVQPGSPYDPDNYLRELKAVHPDVHEIIIRYVSESTASLRSGCLLASTMMLGGACEMLFLLLRDQVSSYLKPPEKDVFDEAIEKARGVKKQHRIVLDCYQKSIRPVLQAKKANADWMTRIESSLNFVFDYFRNARNDVGHPSGTAFSKEMVVIHLVIFRQYVQTVYELIDWLKANPKH